MDPKIWTTQIDRLDALMSKWRQFEMGSETTEESSLKPKVALAAGRADRATSELASR